MSILRVVHAFCSTLMPHTKDLNKTCLLLSSSDSVATEKRKVSYAVNVQSSAGNIQDGDI